MNDIPIANTDGLGGEDIRPMTFIGKAPTVDPVTWEKAGMAIREELGIYTDQDLARALDITPTTLALWRSKGQGPDYCRLGKRIYYSIWAVKAWIRLSQVEVTQPIADISIVGAPDPFTSQSWAEDNKLPPGAGPMTNGG